MVNTKGLKAGLISCCAAGLASAMFVIEVGKPIHAQPGIFMPEPSAEVVGEEYVDIGGGWAGAKATLYRNGILFIDGRAVSNARHSATRATVNIVGVDRYGRALFVSKHLDIPTACARWDTCPSDRSKTNQQNISPDLARYVARLNVHVTDRDGPSFYNNVTRNIIQGCRSYQELPPAARAAIAYQTGFPGCYPGR
jgi:hypothetical protein